MDDLTSKRKPFEIIMMLSEVFFITFYNELPSYNGEIINLVLENFDDEDYDGALSPVG